MVSKSLCVLMNALDESSFSIGRVNNHLVVLSKSFQMNTNITEFAISDSFTCIFLLSYAKVASATKGLKRRLESSFSGSDIAFQLTCPFI